jgi:hypothetical protein
LVGQDQITADAFDEAREASFLLAANETRQSTQQDSCPCLVIGCARQLTLCEIISVEVLVGFWCFFLQAVIIPCVVLGRLCGPLDPLHYYWQRR